MTVVSALVIAALGATCAMLLALLIRERRSESHVGFRAVFEAMQEAALVVAPDGTVLEANPAAVRLLGEADAAAVRGEALLRLAPQLETARRARHGGGEQRRLAGDFDGFAASISRIGGGSARQDASVIVLHDERSDRVRERGLVNAAQSDPLTRAANRAGFTAALEDALKRRDGAAVGLVYVDLDGFKPVNDAHGHAVGDAVLKQVVERLQHGLREGDVVGRLGGDEFALLLREITPAGLASVTGRVREAVAAPMRVGDLDLRIGVSVGVASAPRDGVTVEPLLATADERMYRDKRARQDRDAASAAASSTGPGAGSALGGPPPSDDAAP